MRRCWSIVLGLAFGYLLIFFWAAGGGRTSSIAVIPTTGFFSADMPVPVWAGADPGEEVTLKIGDQTKTATPDAKTARHSGPSNSILFHVGGPIRLTVAGKIASHSRTCLSRSLDLLRSVEHAIPGTRRSGGG